MRTRWIRQLCATMIISLSLNCGGDRNKQAETSATTDTDKTFATILEEKWNYYLRKEMFLGPTYFGNTTSFGRNRGALHALALMSDYPTYRALATKGLITLGELNLADAPDGVFADSATKIERAATVSLTDLGAKAGTMDKNANTVTFVLGTYRIERLTLNEAVSTSHGTFRLVEGTHVLNVEPEFSDVWAELGWSTIRALRFRVVFQYADKLSGKTGQEWRVANASNGRFSAMDTGPRDGNFESENVPPTLDQLRTPRR